MNSADVLRIVNTGGVVGLLIVILLGGLRASPWWVFGRTYKELELDRNLWRDIALRNSNLAEIFTAIEKR